VLVVLAAVLELAEQGTGVVVRHVVVVVRVHERLVLVLVFAVANHPLLHGGLLHGMTSLFEIKPPTARTKWRLQERRSGCGSLSEALRPFAR
jgi:hypothetical protein